MATATKQVSIIHRHLCPQCGEERMCSEAECAPKTPGTTKLLCGPCASNPKTLLELKRELMEGKNDLYNQFVASIAEQIELTPEQNATVTTYLKGTLERRDHLADFVKGIEEEAARLDGRAKEITERSQQFKNIARMFRSSIKMQLENWPGLKSIKRVDGLESSFRVVKNPLHVVITDIAELPGRFINYEPKPDKNAIRDALEKGEAVPGACLSDPSTHLQIK